MTVEANETSDRPTERRRQFLKAVGTLGVAGVAGCLGGDDGTPTDTATPTEADETDMEADETDTETPTDAETPTPTEEGPSLPDDPKPLISIPGGGIPPGAETLTGVLTNSYLFDIQSGTVELEGPEGWEFTPSEGTSFDTLESQNTQEATWEVSMPEDAAGEYELTAHVTYAAGEEEADVTATLPITIDIWIDNEFTEVLHFEDIWENGIDDRMAETPAGEVENGQIPDNWYQYRLDMSAFLPASKLQIHFEDSYTDDGWGPSVWDTSVIADGEEIHYLRSIYGDEEYFYEDNSQIDDFFEDHQWRYADGVAGANWTYEFDVPGDPDEVIVEITLRNAFIFSARSSPASDAGKDDVTATMTPAQRIPYTGDDGGGVVTDPDPAPRFLGPEFSLPHGPTYEYIDEGAVEQASPPNTNEDIRAELFFGYDEDNLYVQAEVTDDEHVAVAGEDMWQADSLQFAAGSGGEYGPEYGVAHVDGESQLHQWVEGAAEAGTDVIDATTSREGGVTTYELTIPWEALYDEPRGEAGDNGPFGVLINEADSDDGERDAVLGWTLPGINEEKSVDALGTLLLENPLEGDGG
jgi:hypothetical protein